MIDDFCCRPFVLQYFREGRPSSLGSKGEKYSGTLCIIKWRIKDGNLQKKRKELRTAAQYRLIQRAESLAH